MQNSQSYDHLTRWGFWPKASLLIRLVATYFIFNENILIYRDISFVKIYRYILKIFYYFMQIFHDISQIWYITIYYFMIYRDISHDIIEYIDISWYIDDISRYIGSKIGDISILFFDISPILDLIYRILLSKGLL